MVAVIIFCHPFTHCLINCACPLPVLKQAGHFHTILTDGDRLKDETEKSSTKTQFHDPYTFVYVLYAYHTNSSPQIETSYSIEWVLVNFVLFMQQYWFILSIDNIYLPSPVF